MTAPAPALPLFADGQIPTAIDLNSFAANITNLYAYTQGGFRLRRPIVAVRVTRENREIPTGSDFQMQWDVADIDTDHMFSGVLSENLTVRTAGVWRVGFAPALVPVTTAYSSTVLAARILLNGTSTATDAIAAAHCPIQTGLGAAVLATTEVSLSANDVITCWANHNSGVTAGIDPAFGGTRAWAIWLGPLP